VLYLQPGATTPLGCPDVYSAGTTCTDYKLADGTEVNILDIPGRAGPPR